MVFHKDPIEEIGPSLSVSLGEGRETLELEIVGPEVESLPELLSGLRRISPLEVTDTKIEVRVDNQLPHIAIFRLVLVQTPQARNRILPIALTKQIPLGLENLELGLRVVFQGCAVPFERGNRLGTL